MARILCQCENVISNSTNPEVQYRVFSQEEYINTLDRLDEGEKLINMGLPSLKFWKCLHCRRILIFNVNKDKLLAVYKIEIEHDKNW